MQVQVARVWWSHTFYPACVSVLSSCVNNGSFTGKVCNIFHLY